MQGGFTRGASRVALRPREELTHSASRAAFQRQGSRKVRHALCFSMEPASGRAAGGRFTLDPSSVVSLRLGSTSGSCVTLYGRKA